MDKIKTINITEEVKLCSLENQTIVSVNKSELVLNDKFLELEIDFVSKEKIVNYELNISSEEEKFRYEKTNLLRNKITGTEIVLTDELVYKLYVYAENTYVFMYFENKEECDRINDLILNWL